jgi:hypothetical protein
MPVYSSRRMLSVVSRSNLLDQLIPCAYGVNQARIGVLSHLSSIHRQMFIKSVPVHVETNQSALKLSAKLISPATNT